VRSSPPRAAGRHLRHDTARALDWNRPARR
jgi:hypothetical protein